MAGRGTDIVLGGNYDAEIKAMDNPSIEKVNALKKDWDERHKKVIESGGLHIIEPKDMSRDVLIINFVVVQDVKAILVQADFIFHWKII